MNIISAQLASALNNYNSIAPIVTKDLVENGGRTAMAYFNAGEKTRKYEVTEKFLEANASSALWYGAIPFVKKMTDMTAFKIFNLNPNVSLELLNSKNHQNINKSIKKIQKNELPSTIATKGILFKKAVKITDTQKVLENIKNNSKKYKALHIGRLAVSTIIPTYLSAVVLPKVIMSLTQHFVDADKTTKKNNPQSFKNKMEFTSKNFKDFKNFTSKLTNKQKISFKSLSGMLLEKAQGAQKSLLGDMVAVDLAISGSRIYYANKREKEALNGEKTNAPYAAALEKLIREGGFLYLIYFGGKQIKNGIDKLTNNKFDPLILEDKNFVSELKNKKFDTNPLKNLTEEKALKFIDKNINNDNQTFIKYAKKIGLIETVTDKTGKKFRNPFKYLDIKKLNSQFDDFAQSAKNFINKGGDNLEGFVKRQIKVKRAGIFGNLIASSFAVCYILPKMVYGFRKFYTGTTEEPGIKMVIKRTNDTKN